MGDATGVGGGGALPGAPLDTGFRRYDNSGCAGRQVLLVAEGGGPTAAGRPFESLRAIGFSKRPYGGVGEWGMRRGLVVGLPCPSHLWIPAFAGTTIAGVRAGKCCWWRRVGVPLRRDGRFSKRPCGGVGEWGMRRGLVVGLPCPSHLWIPAFAGTTIAGVRAGKCCWWRRVGVPLRRDGPSRASG